MKKRTATILNIILLVATAFLGDGMAAPQGPGPRGGRSFIPPQRVVERIPAITAEQLGEIDLLKEEAKAAMEFLVGQQREIRQELKTHLDSEAPDPSVVGGLVISGKDVAEEIRASHKEFRETFEAVLTSEQLEALKELTKTLNSRRRGGRRSGGFPIR